MIFKTIRCYRHTINGSLYSVWVKLIQWRSPNKLEKKNWRPAKGGIAIFFFFSFLLVRAWRHETGRTYPLSNTVLINCNPSLPCFPLTLSQSLELFGSFQLDDFCHQKSKMFSELPSVDPATIASENVLWNLFFGTFNKVNDYSKSVCSLLIIYSKSVIN